MRVDSLILPEKFCQSIFLGFQVSSTINLGNKNLCLFELRCNNTKSTSRVLLQILWFKIHCKPIQFEPKIVGNWVIAPIPGAGVWVWA